MTPKMLQIRGKNVALYPGFLISQVMTAVHHALLRKKNNDFPSVGLSPKTVSVKGGYNFSVQYGKANKREKLQNKKFLLSLNSNLISKLFEKFFTLPTIVTEL